MCGYTRRVAWMRQIHAFRPPVCSGFFGAAVCAELWRPPEWVARRSGARQKLRDVLCWQVLTAVQLLLRKMEEDECSMTAKCAL